ncbi:hypothetical protein F610DRAFT_06786 [Streptomyces sp. LaPpAH-199]|nr:hypothetical protein F610DRAFT_01895 [Streptomyces sp. LaPpAH-199]SDE31014.1 hypothetical protein F610DRAFT_06786 [Streptomyces sp. LaPpAH-199]
MVHKACWRRVEIAAAPVAVYKKVHAGRQGKVGSLIEWLELVGQNDLANGEVARGVNAGASKVTGSKSYVVHSAIP